MSIILNGTTGITNADGNAVLTGGNIATITQGGTVTEYESGGVTYRVHSFTNTGNFRFPQQAT
jgi:hypothetical protein